MPTILQFISLLAILITVVHVAESEKTRESLFGKNGPCKLYEYRCLNNKCIKRNQYCNRVDDCGDNSDENFCNVYSCPDNFYTQCSRGNYNKCIPKHWICDGVSDCPNHFDEKDCDTISDVLTPSKVYRAGQKALNWIFLKRNKQSRTLKWGSNIPRIATALYLNDLNFVEHANVTDEIAYELNLSLLSRLALKKIEDIPTSELALYVNALLLSCTDPRKFHVVDLVKELRKRVDSSNSTNPTALLALCNAQEMMKETDIINLTNAFWESGTEHHVDTQALIIMTLACAQKQNMIDQEDLSEMTMELKKKQYRNGTVENIKTTALVLQALFASETEADDDNFDEKKAIHQIIRAQRKDGSFGSFLNTYYALPALNHLSFVNISSAHCIFPTSDENEGLQYLKNQVGEKWTVKFSIWIGEGKILQRSIALSVPANTSFYSIMEYASGLDDKYKFEYNVRNRKPYIFVLSGIMDDPEMGNYWLPYFLLNEGTGETKPIQTSVADVYPKNKDHLVFWYRKHK